MDLIRLIKLKKINGELDNLTEQEELFFSFFDGLYSIKEDDIIYLFKNNEYVFVFYLINDILWCSYKYVWSVFKNKYKLNDKQIDKLITSILNKRLNLVGASASKIMRDDMRIVEKHQDFIKTKIVY